MQASELVREFWELMASNDFYAVGQLLAEDFVLEWPQSNERIRGATKFGKMNAEYPAHGRWTFSIQRIVGNLHEAVSDVLVSDGVQHARAVSFFTITDGKISKIVEYWPDPYPAPANRAHLVEPLAG
jgi:ketosteroid isomerase-like protein